jgi:hypothetical protein
MLIAGGQKMRSFNILELLKAVAEIRQVRTIILRVIVNIGIFFKDRVLSSFGLERRKLSSYIW